jgi:opacity protein-like surface antigen
MASLKALTLASVAVLALTRFATAADLLPPPPMPEPPPPAAAEFSGWYLRGDIGMAVNDGSNLSFANSPNPLAGTYYQPGATQSFNNTSISSSELFDVGVGYQFNSWLRGDITGEYRDGGHFQSLYSLSNPNWAQSGNANQISQLLDFYRANTSSAVGLVNLYADLGTWYGVTPFVGGGAGVAYNRLYGMTDQGQVSFNGGATGPSGGYFNDGARTNFAWAVMAGLDFNITPNLKLELGYRYLNLGKIGSGGSNCANGVNFAANACGGQVTNYVSSSNTLASNDFRIGLRYMLGGETYAPPPPEAPAPLVRRY